MWSGITWVAAAGTVSTWSGAARSSATMAVIILVSEASATRACGSSAYRICPASTSTTMACWPLMTGAPVIGWAASQLPEKGCGLTAGVLGIALGLLPGTAVLALELGLAATAGVRARPVL